MLPGALAASALATLLLSNTLIFNSNGFSGPEKQVYPVTKILSFVCVQYFDSRPREMLKESNTVLWTLKID